MERDFILKVEDITVFYEDAGNRKIRKKEGQNVLNQVSFELKRGEIVGLVGESGSGKSTLAKAVLGMVKTESGTITHKSEKPQMIFQDPYSALNPAKKIGWILEEPLLMKGIKSKEERKRQAKVMLQKVGLDEKYYDRYPKELSGGMRQRVSIGAALITSPELLIADEPVSALDVTIQAQIISLLKKLHEELGLTILFISHDLRVVYQFCDRVMIMKEGRIVEEGERDQIFFEPEHHYTKTLLNAAGIFSEEEKYVSEILSG